MTDGERPIRIVSMNCWHSNEVIYQADGMTDDHRHIYVRYRSPYFSVGVGATPDDACGADTFVTAAHPDADPSRISLATLRAWTAGASPEIIWPDRINGYANEPGGPG